MQQQLRGTPGAAGAEQAAVEQNASVAQGCERPMPGIAERLHALVKEKAPDLSPKTWYGMPAYARDGSVVCFFQTAAKFKSRYATLGFSDKAKLDDGAMWPTSFAITELNAAVERRIVELLEKAVG